MRTEIKEIIQEIFSKESRIDGTVRFDSLIIKNLIRKGFAEINISEYLRNHESIICELIYSCDISAHEEQLLCRHELINLNRSKSNLLGKDSLNNIFIKDFTIEVDSDSLEKRKLREYSKYIENAIENLINITPKEFELLMKYFLGLIDVCNVKISQYSNDQGIDFVGEITNTNNQLLDDIAKQTDISIGFFSDNFYRELNTKVIGQVKKYGTCNKVKPKEIREFIGSYYMEKSKLMNLSYNGKLLEPVRAIFITTSNYSLNSKKTAEETGITLINGPIIGVILLDNYFQYNESYSSNLFKGWLKSIID